MRLAVISDVHGNLGALEAVLADIVRHHVDDVVNLGDALSGPLLPAECAERLLPMGIPTVRGNHERQLLTQSSEQMSSSDRFTAACVRPEHVQWIGSFPATRVVFEDVLLCHGTPRSDAEYFLESIDEAGFRRAHREEVKERAGSSAGRLILCGHSHLPGTAQLEDGRLIVNPGAVGLQAYDALWPHPHRVETGSPHARYAIAERLNGDWDVELLTVKYDWERAAQIAEQNGRVDWARSLRSGLA